MELQTSLGGASYMRYGYERSKVIQLLIRNLDLARVNSLNDIVWWLAVDGAADRLRSAQNLLATVGQRLRK